MSACSELGDLRRARLWIDATARWLATLPVAVLFTGICRVHRAQVLQACGDWTGSEEEAARVCRELTGVVAAATAEGHYQIGELARLRGDADAAEVAYQEAHRGGRVPQPGLALLRLAQGRVDMAAAAVRTALLAETVNRLARAPLLAGAAEVAVAAGDVAAAEEAVRELDDIAQTYLSPCFTAAARQWRGALLLAGGHATAAVPVLQEARRHWQDLGMPYGCARVRVLLARACRELGDADGAELELAAVAEVFARLGAVPDVAAVAELRGHPAHPGGLTGREVDVLRCLAAGRTNREIAAALVISEKTVSRHLSNIFTKLELPTRTAVTAWAHRNGLTG